MEDPQRSERSQRLVLAGLSLGYFMVLFDTTALTVALPDLARSLGSSIPGLAWVTDAYTLTFAGCLLAGGAIADRRGAGPTFLAGLAGFGVLSLACAAAPSTAGLIAGRALLGVAGALLLPASLALIAGLFADPGRRAAAIGTWASISAVALATGPLLGGALVAWLGWRGIFLVNPPVAILAALLLRNRMPRTPRRRARTEVGGQLAALVAVTAITWALVRGGTRGWGSPDVLAAIAVAALAAAAALAAERSSAAPAIPPALLRVPLVGAALAGGFVVGGVFAGELFVTTLQLQEIRGLGPVLTGLAFLPLTIPMIFNPPRAGRLVARVGPSRPILGGLLLIALGAIILAGVPAGASYGWIGVGLAVLGFGISFTLPALTGAVVLAAPADATGAASGLFSVVRQVGATVGVAIAAALLGDRISHPGRIQALMAGAAALAALVWWAATATRYRAGSRGGAGVDRPRP
jgi:DHA2 family methylenomycin A resistance protein-like MFS transporter